MLTEYLLEVQDLQVQFPVHLGMLTVVDGINLRIKAGEILGLVGESGSGKTVTGRAILRLVPRPGRITGGKVIFKGRNLLEFGEEEIRLLRGKEITAIQQDPASALNPAFRIEDQMTDIITLHNGVNKSTAARQAIELLAQLGIPDPELVMKKYPHQLSGGMAQRVMIGIAFSCNPSLIIADEPTTALDVITQATVIKLMKDMQKKFNASVLFITHNLGLAAKICDKIAIMYAGKIVEYSSVDGIFARASHPYTKGLLSSVPKISDNAKRMSTIAGSMPDLFSRSSGCRFYNRCPIAVEQCKNTEITFAELPDRNSEHRALCLRAMEVFEKKLA